MTHCVFARVAMSGDELSGCRFLPPCVCVCIHCLVAVCTGTATVCSCCMLLLLGCCSVVVAEASFWVRTLKYLSALTCTNYYCLACTCMNNWYAILACGFVVCHSVVANLQPISESDVFPLVQRFTIHRLFDVCVCYSLLIVEALLGRAESVMILR